VASNIVDDIADDTASNVVDEAGALEGGSTAEFKSEELLTNHFEKHANEFGDITKEQYLSKAQNFADSIADGNVLTNVRANGDVIIYNKAKNEFAVKTSEGIIRTYFKPAGGLD